MYNVTIVGAGYVGLTLAIHLANKGVKVLAVDKNIKIIEKLNRGECPIFEESLKDPLDLSIKSGNLSFSTKFPEDGCSHWILAVSYFPGDKSHYIDLLGDIKGTEQEAPTIMIRGTVPVGYISNTILPALEKQFKSKNNNKFYLASTPERSLSGNALEELTNLPQLIGATKESYEKASLVYKKANIACIHLPNIEAGEIAKSFTNFARLVQFNLANYLGALCHKFNVSDELMLASIKDNYPRLDFLNKPGPGVGGFCLPKDSLVLYDGVTELFERNNEIDQFIEFPNQQFHLNQSIIHFHAELTYNLVKDRKKMVAFGMAFKGMPKTDDTRDSTGVVIVNKLIEKKMNVFVKDLTVDKEKLIEQNLPVADDNDLKDYDAVLILNNDPDYKKYILKHIDNLVDETFDLYDPWRLIVSPEQSIFQKNFEKKKLI